MSSHGERSDEEDVLELLGEHENQDSNHGSENELQGDEDEVQEVRPENFDEDAPGNSGQNVTPKGPKRTRSSVPRLNTEFLKGPKGVHKIEKYFEGFKFYGKGREKDDLDRIMKRLEHWTHRLFPKLKFDDGLAKIEHLGSKKDLQVFLKKYRTDMISADEDLMTTDIVSDNDDEPGETAPVEEFDLLLAEQIEKQRHNETTTNIDTSAFDNLLASANSQPTRNEPGPSMSDEVKERIERNRRLALERKQATMKRLLESKKAAAGDNLNSSINSLNESQTLVNNSTEKPSDEGKADNNEENNPGRIEVNAELNESNLASQSDSVAKIIEEPAVVVEKDKIDSQKVEEETDHIPSNLDEN